jgi:hypothetical protein
MPRLTAKFLDKLRLNGFVLVPLAELEQLQTAADALLKRQYSMTITSAGKCHRLGSKV